MNGIAINIGSAYSTAARLNDEGIPTLIADAEDASRFRTPSLICLSPHGVLVGHAAVVASRAQPDLPTIEDAKSMLASGRTLATDPANKEWSAEECVGLLVTKLRQDASADCFASVDEVLLTVPGCFNSAQRHALRQAAQAAGLRVRGLVNEAIAAAAYATATSAEEQTVLVVQTGVGSVEVATVRRKPGNTSLLVSRHDRFVGGKAIDQAIADEVCKAHSRDRKVLSRGADRQLMAFAEELKLALCQTQPGQNPPDQVQRQGIVGGTIFDFALTRWHFQQLIAPLLQRIFELAEKCLLETGLDWTKIDRIVLAGGTTQLAELRRALAERSGLSPDCIFDKDATSAVAYGGALLAALPDDRLVQYDDSRSSSDGDVRHALAQNDQGQTAMWDYGVRIGDPRSGQAAIYKLVKRGTTLPTTATKQFRTSRADQRRLVIEVVKTRGSVRRAESVGQFALALPSGLPAGHPVNVAMHCDAAGQVRVEAHPASLDVSGS